MLNRRKFLTRTAAIATASFGSALIPGLAFGQSNKLRLGMMLPSSGTFAVVGESIVNGFNLALKEYGGTLGGREVEIFSVDDESNPSKASDNANRLVKRDEVDVLIGSVHSGVTLAMSKVARDSGTILVIPNAGADALTGPMCAPNVFRTSFSNWQIAYAAGQLVAERKHKKVVTLAWKYTTGEEMVEGFKDAFEANGGTIAKELYLPFPNVEFQPFMAEIAAIRPDAVYVFIAGSGGVKFVQDYAGAGLKDIPLYAPGFLTDGLLGPMGEAAQGITTTLHYADGLDTPKDNAFRKAYSADYKETPDVFAVQGYDTAQLLHHGMGAVNGDVANQKALIAAMASARIDSPRGTFTMSPSHNPIQNVYIREVEGGQNQYVGVAAKDLEDPGKGCRI